jgi:hypothetical protein
MKLASALPFFLGSLTAVAVSLQSGGQETGQEQEGPRGVRKPLQPDEDDLPSGTGNLDVGAVDVFGRRVRAPRNTLVDRIKGGWMMTEFEMENSSRSGRTAIGFLNVGEHYLSLEVHAYWDGPPKASEYDIHQTFTAEYNLDATGRLTCRTMMGSYLDELTGKLLWERAGFPREYQVEETNRELVLRWGGPKNRMVFRPRPPMMRGQIDIFGRRKVLEPGEEDSLDKDIFGRKKADEGGATDIFGRKVPPEEEKEAGAGASGSGGEKKEGAGTSGARGGGRD